MSWELPDRISLREVGPRDGLQNEDPVPTDAKVSLLDRLSQTGVGRIEAVSFVRPSAIPQMADADEVWKRANRSPSIRYSALVPNLRGALRALDAGFTELEAVVSASETHNRKNVNRSTEQSLDEIAEIIEQAHARGATVQVIVSTAWGCPYEGDVPVARTVSVAGRAIADGADSASFGDTTGMATPTRVRSLVGAFRDAHPETSLNLHFHNTRGTGLANVLAALELGVADFDASVGGLGGCPYAPGATGNIATEELAAMVEDMGVATGIDLEAMIDAAAEAERIVGHTLPSQVLRAGPPNQDDPVMTESTDFEKLRETIERGGAARYHEAAAARGKLFARDRIALLTDEGSFTEDGRYANALAEGLPADGVVTGTASVDGRPVAVMANDSTVKAGSWGARTVEKIIRIIEKAYQAGLPMIYLVDSAGARITDQVDMFPGRRGAGRIFRTQIEASGSIPQVCALFGPSAAGGAYIPAFCDFTAMVDGNASMYLGSPRMVEMVVSEKTTLEEMGGARLHCTVSGSGHLLAATEAEAIQAVRRYLSYLPQNWSQPPPAIEAREPKPTDLRALVPDSERQAFDMRRFVRGLVDEDSFFEIHALWAREVVTGFARLAGQVIGVVANNPMFKGGVLFVDSADKAARFIQVCDAFGIPLLFLADVPGFMVGTAVERQGIIRHGAKMIAAMSDATVPKICVVVRKAYGAGLYAMAGPGFEPDATLALPTAKIAVMGAEAAVNAVYAGKLEQIADARARAEETERLRRDYDRDIDILRLAAELVIDDIVEPEDLRPELVRRFAIARAKPSTPPPPRRKHGISPA